MPVIIEADDLTKSYNDTVAVSHIRFEVNKGEIFGFLGQTAQERPPPCG